MSTSSLEIKQKVYIQTGAIEALYKKLTGEFAKFAEQYFVDCTFTYSGCAGGTTNDGYKITLLRQFMLYESFHRYTADCTCFY